MADTPDPAAVATAAVRTMIDQWMTLSTAVAERTLGPVGAVPPTMAETVGRVLAALNLPTRADILKLDARLQRIEAALAEPNRNDARSPRTTSRRTTMADLSKIKEHMNLIGADGVHVGTVDHVDGDRIKLTKTDSGDHHHHWISGGLVAEVEGNDVRLSANAAVAVTFEEDA
jgi:hypothetical protein